MLEAVRLPVPSVGGRARVFAGEKPEARSVKALPQAGDAVRFRGAGGSLASRYGIDPGQVDVVKAPHVQLPISKEQLLEKLLESHEHAVKNKLLGNFSGRQFSSNMLLANGQWALGTNIELTRDNILCGERSALVNSWNQALNRLPLQRFQDPAGLPGLEKDLKVQLLAMASGKEPADPIAGSPCSECQSWLSTQKYFSPDTLITSLSRNEQTGRYFIRVRQMRDLLPLLESQTPSKADGPLRGAPVYSQKAAEAAQSRGIDDAAVRKLLAKARQAYSQNQTAPHSLNKNSGVAVLLSNGKVYTGQRLDWTARWFESPDLMAVARGIQAETPRALQAGLAAPRVVAVAYYGDGLMPEVKNLGILAQETWGGPDTLMVVVENNTPQVRTIRDYMTDIYISPSQHAKR